METPSNTKLLRAVLIGISPFILLFIYAAISDSTTSPEPQTVPEPVSYTSLGTFTIDGGDENHEGISDSRVRLWRSDNDENTLTEDNRSMVALIDRYSEVELLKRDAAGDYCFVQHTNETEWQVGWLNCGWLR